MRPISDDKMPSPLAAATEQPRSNFRSFSECAGSHLWRACARLRFDMPKLLSFVSVQHRAATKSNLLLSNLSYACGSSRPH
jgi:hypothetical protein